MGTTKTIFMNEKIVVPVITAILGFLLAIIVQQLKWIQHRNNKRDEVRRKFLEDIRAHLLSKEFNKEEFIKTVLYSQLRHYLPASIKLEMENLYAKFETTIGPLREDIEYRILDQISLIERKWKLI
jgi:hypothetical protein